MPPADLDVLAAAVAQMTEGPWAERFIYRMFKAARSDVSLLMGATADTDWPNAAGIVALVNAAPALLELAREALAERERTCLKCARKFVADGGHNACGMALLRGMDSDNAACAHFGGFCGAFIPKEDQ